LIFCLEIIIKFYDIRFDDSSEEKKEEYKEEFFGVSSNSLNVISESLKKLIPKPIWEKIFLLTEHPNFKLNIFSTYIINYLKPDHLTDKMQEKVNYVKQKKEELSEIKNYFNDKFGILSIKKKQNNNNSASNNPNILNPFNSLNLMNANNNNNNNYNLNANIDNLYNNNSFGNNHHMNNLLLDSIDNNLTSQNLENNFIHHANNFNGLQQQNSTVPAENISLKSLWFSTAEMQSLKNYIKVNIIDSGKLRNDISNVFKSINPNEDKDESDSSSKKLPESELTEDIDFFENKKKKI